MSAEAAFAATKVTGREAALPGRSRPGWQHHRGTHRVVAPEQTWRRMCPYLRSYGITRVADVTELDIIGIPVMLVIRPNARSLSRTSSSQASDRAVS